MTSSPPPPPYTLTDDGSAQPPPLPPRQQPESSMSALASVQDPRSSSTQSLVPAPGETAGRRRLLLVYVHGFMGDETSFQSFPAHLHNILTITMAESHVVHTKIYPKYRSRYSLEVARDDFSKWLTPHEDQWTDVVLLGHSMGGLLAADIALLCKHNIIGVVNFDVPFVGMHPGIVKAGLGSIFKPWAAPENTLPVSDGPEGKRPSRVGTLFNPKPSDPNYNPNFYNDVHLPVRKGWENALHFLNKHTNDIISAGKGLVKSHIEFGGAMADYRELKARYARIRALEEDNEEVRRSANPQVQHPPRIRFVNYYTASTGRPKKPKSPKSASPSRPSSRGLEHRPSNTASPGPSSPLALTHNSQPPGTISPRISVEEHRGNEVIPVTPEGSLRATSPAPTTGTISPRISVELHRDNQVIPVTPQEPPSATSPPAELPFRSTPSNSDTGPTLPEIPPIPPEPPFVDLAQYPDKAERKAAEKQHSQALKDYQRAVKARNTVIKERSKIEERWQKQKQKQLQASPAPKSDKSDSAPESEVLEEDIGAVQLGAQPKPEKPSSTHPYGNYEFSHSTIMAQPHPDDRPPITGSSAASTNTSYADSTTTLTTLDTNDTTAQHESSTQPAKKKRYKKFCMLPPKDSSGNKDPTWVRVFMENMDEVAAHTSLFFLSETYERLVGDVADRIEEWVRENESARVVREMQGWN